MGKTRRFASLLSLSMAICTAGGPAFADPSDEGDSKISAAPATEGSESPKAGSNAPEDPARKAERLQKRRERLEQGAKRLRERAAELKKRAANGETAPPPAANSKRPTRSLEEQAQRFEEQAAKMDERAKNLDSSDEPSSARTERFTGSPRERRHQIRRVSANRRWGATLRNPDAIAELKLHAERTARLKRIRSLALKKSKDDPAAKRATELLAKEDDRHDRHMKALQELTPKDGTVNTGVESK